MGSRDVGIDEFHYLSGYIGFCFDNQHARQAGSRSRFVLVSLLLLTILMLIFLGMITGMRGLCNGIGPAIFGVIFYLFHVDLNETEESDVTNTSESQHLEMYTRVCANFI